MKSSLIAELTKGLIEAQKAIDNLNAEEVCSAIDIAAVFIDQNIEKFADVSFAVAKHVAESETIRNTVVHTTEVVVKNVESLSRNKSFMEQIDLFETAIQDAADRAEATTKTEEEIKARIEYCKNAIKDNDAFIEHQKEKESDPSTYQSTIDMNGYHTREIAILEAELEARASK